MIYLHLVRDAEAEELHGAQPAVRGGAQHLKQT